MKLVMSKKGAEDGQKSMTLSLIGILKVLLAQRVPVDHQVLEE